MCKDFLKSDGDITHQVVNQNLIAVRKGEEGQKIAAQKVTKKNGGKINRLM
jgi:hypothetical protein